MLNLGAKAFDLLEWLLSQRPEIRSLEVVQFRPVASVSDRMGEKPKIYQLISRRPWPDGSAINDDIPLWIPRNEVSLIDLIARDKLLDSNVQKMVWHDETGEDVVHTVIARGDFNKRTLLKMTAKRPRWPLAISSMVRLSSNRHAHLPLVDFQCPAKDVKYLPVIVKAMEAIGETDGAILVSGQSFHYYGFKLLNLDGWRRFLGKCLLMQPLTDTRYIGHRLIDGDCRLRLFADDSRIEPTIVAIGQQGSWTIGGLP